jgi:hypothetical protein
MTWEDVNRELTIDVKKRFILWCQPLHRGKLSRGLFYTVGIGFFASAADTAGP